MYLQYRAEKTDTFIIVTKQLLGNGGGAAALDLMLVPQDSHACSALPII